MSVDAAMNAVKEAFQANSSVYYILAASIVQLIAACIACDRAWKCEDYVAYAVAVGCVSVVFTGLHAILCSFKPLLADKIAPGLSIFLFLWWIPGAGVCTFIEPFLIVGNGYFASWVALLSSLHFFQQTGLALISGSKKSSKEAPAGNQA